MCRVKPYSLTHSLTYSPNITAYAKLNENKKETKTSFCFRRYEPGTNSEQFRVVFLCFMSFYFSAKQSIAIV